MAGSNPLVISNPKENNRDYEVYWFDHTGAKKLMHVLRPGDSVRPERARFVVEEVRPPARLWLQPDGTVAQDPRPTPKRMLKPLARRAATA